MVGCLHPDVAVRIEARPARPPGKLVELAVRDVVHGLPARNTDALANREALDFFRDLPELKS